MFIDIVYQQLQSAADNRLGLGQGRVQKRQRAGTFQVEVPALCCYGEVV